MATLTVDPSPSLVDEPIRITAAGFAPRSRVRLTLRAVTLRATASEDFFADENGALDVAEPMRLFWNARFEEGADVLSTLEMLTALTPLEYRLEAAVDSRSAASTRFERRSLVDGVVVTSVRDGAIRGSLFAPAGAVSAPAVIVLGGSDGGKTFDYVAALLAARGFAALSLAYFAYDDLPEDLVEIPLEYGAEAVAWLRARPEVSGKRVGVLGFSMGGQLALLLGAHFSDVGAVVALVPSGISGGGISRNPARMARSAWTLGGKPLPMIPPRFDPESMKAFAEAMGSGKPVAMTPGFLRLLESASLDGVTIPVERTAGPILLMSAGDDQVWPSVRLTEIAVERLRSARCQHPVQHLTYPNAGHFASLPPYIPTTVTFSRHPQVPFVLEMGGTPEANAAASADLWPRLIVFLRAALGGA